MIGWLAGILLLISSAFANPVAGAVGKFVCEAGPQTSIRIILKSIATLYNVFPIKIGGVKVMSWNELEDLDLTGNFPACICMTPFPRVGIKISLWEPIAIMEPVKIPWCTPLLPIPGGLVGKVPFNAFALGADSHKANEGSAGTELRSLQVHYYRYLPWAILELFMDFVCLETRNPFDMVYMTEIDPLWQNDLLASILGPEAILVANPIAQFACIVDAVTSQFGFPLDPLWWCFGSWGSAYPLSENITSLDAPQSAAGLVARMLFKLHRELVLWGSFGKAGLCGRYPMPVMMKSQYSIFPIYPIPYPKRFPIGRSSLVLWGFGKEVPVLNRHNQNWMIYRKRDCCAF